MTTPDGISIGERVRFYRQGQGKSQAVISGLAEISELVVFPNMAFELGK